MREFTSDRISQRSQKIVEILEKEGIRDPNESLYNRCMHDIEKKREAIRQHEKQEAQKVLDENAKWDTIREQYQS